METWACRWRRAQGADDGVGVPPGLVFDAITIDRALAQQVVEVDEEFAVRNRHRQLPLFANAASSAAMLSPLVLSLLN